MTRARPPADTASQNVPSPAPLVSVVTPTLDQGRFIGETIASVLSQDYPALEYVVVDGGSSDETLEILRRHSSALRSFVAPGEGQSAAINRGLRATTGEIVAWLNSDDTYLPGAVQKAVAYLLEHQTVDVVYGDCDYVDSAGQVLRPYPVAPFDYRRLVRTAVCSIPQPAAFLRRRALDSGFLDESLGYALDLDLWLRLGAAGHAFEYLPARLATLRLHRQAKSVRALDGFAAELLKIYERLFAQADLSGDIRALESEALSNVHYRASQCLFWAGRMKDARRLALRALTLAPLNLRPQLLFALCGSPAQRLLARFRGNPFTQGIAS